MRLLNYKPTAWRDIHGCDVARRPAAAGVIPVNWLKIGPTFLPVSFNENHLMDCGPWLPLQWVAERHFVDPKCIEYMAGPVFELFTAANVSELADSRPGDEREQILRLAGLSPDSRRNWRTRRFPIPVFSSQGPSIWMPISGR